MSSGGYSGVTNGTTGTQGSLEQMNYELAAIENESRLSNGSLIKNKFHDVQSGKEYDYTRKDNKIYLKDGINNANFIVDKNGNLHIGNGHSYMAHGDAVQAAGTLKINSSGHIRRVTNLSGHYQPTVSETVRYLDQMHNGGYITEKTWVDIYSFDKTKSGYVTRVKTVYSGPYKYMKRRIAK